MKGSAATHPPVQCSFAKTIDLGITNAKKIIQMISPNETNR